MLKMFYGQLQQLQYAYHTGAYFKMLVTKCHSPEVGSGFNT